MTPASGKNLWTGDENLNTWNGPIVRAPDGLYHLYDPVYAHGSLWNTLYTAHGVSTSPSGPFDWSQFPNLTVHDINPAALIYPNSSGSGMVYSVWIGGKILTANSPSGPFVQSYTYSASNPAPVYYKGNFYLTDQDTTTIRTTSSLDKPWTVFTTVPHPKLPYTVEDPFLWVDRRGNWHIINHAYNTGQRINCTTSYVSSHFYSADGKVWGWSDEPYGHTVQFDDGTEHSFCTLERPNLVFDQNGYITHINLAADLVTQNEGCPNRGKGCVDCK